MKIPFCGEKRNEFEYKWLTYGDVFVLEGSTNKEYYMKTNQKCINGQDEQFMAVDLRTGFMKSFPDDTCVETVNCELKVND